MSPKNSRCFVRWFRIARFGDLTKQKACSCLKKLRCNCSDFCKTNHPCAIFSKRWLNSWWESQGFCRMETLEPTSLPKYFVAPQLICQNLTVFVFWCIWDTTPSWCFDRGALCFNKNTCLFFFSGFRVWSKEGKGGSWNDETGASGGTSSLDRFSPQKVEQKEAKRGNLYDEPYKTHRKLNTSPTGFVHLFLLLGIKTETLSKRKASSIALEKRFQGV